MIAKALQLRYSELGYNKRKELANAISKTESYLAGYNQQYGKDKSFRKWYSNYKKLEYAPKHLSSHQVFESVQVLAGNHI